MKKLSTKDFVPLNAFKHLVCDPAYTFRGEKDLNSPLVNKFPGLYHPKAKVIWAHNNIAAITVLAAEICRLRFGWRLRVADCLRPVEAQEAMEAYGFHPSLVSMPGTGAHPRGMAIDLIPEIQERDGSWRLVDMGVPFDHFVCNPEDENPAARDYKNFTTSPILNTEICLNRQRLTIATSIAAETLGHQIWPLDDEWWDYRLTPEVTDKYTPLKESDLPPMMRMINPDLDMVSEIFEGHYPDDMRERIEKIKALTNTHITVNPPLDCDFN